MCVDSSRIQIRFVGFLLESIISQCILGLKSTLGPLWHLTCFICQKNSSKRSPCPHTVCWLRAEDHCNQDPESLVCTNMCCTLSQSYWMFLGWYFQISATCDLPTETSPTRALWVCVMTCTENIWTWTLMAKYHHFILPPSKHLQLDCHIGS